MEHPERPDHTPVFTPTVGTPQCGQIVWGTNRIEQTKYRREPQTTYKKLQANQVHHQKSKDHVWNETCNRNWKTVNDCDHKLLYLGWVKRIHISKFHPYHCNLIFFQLSASRPRRHLRIVEASNCKCSFSRTDHWDEASHTETIGWQHVHGLTSQAARDPIHWLIELWSKHIADSNCWCPNLNQQAKRCSPRSKHYLSTAFHCLVFQTVQNLSAPGELDAY